jgi:hypothetical protein
MAQGVDREYSAVKVFLGFLSAEGATEQYLGFLICGLSLAVQKAVLLRRTGKLLDVGNDPELLAFSSAARVSFDPRFKQYKRTLKFAIPSRPEPDRRFHSVSGGGVRSRTSL